MEKKNYDEVLPSFLGIGTMRSGTSWLYKVLINHPEIYLCSYKKEIHFFDRNYDKSLTWYEQFFPSLTEAKNYKAIGEITPKYIYDETIPLKVKNTLPDARFIVMLRNPVDRAFSQYNYVKLNRGYRDSFTHYYKNHPSCLELGLYAKQLKVWLNYFPLNKFLILIFEEVMANPQKALNLISKFLNVDPSKFDMSVLSKKVNPSDIPKLHSVFQLGYKFSKYLEKKEYYKLAGKLSKVKRIFYVFGKKKKKKNKELELRNELLLDYKEDIKELEKILERNLKIWFNY